MRTRLSSRGLSRRPVEAEPAAIATTLNNEIIPILGDILRNAAQATTPFSIALGSASLDAAIAHDFAASDLLTTDSTLTLLNGQDGHDGYIFVKQDSPGGHDLEVVADGRTLLRVDPYMDDTPGSGAGDVTRYYYRFVTVAGTAYLLLERQYLL